MELLTLLDLPDQEYHSIEAISSHTLMRALKSYEHTLVPVEQTEAMRLGSAVHMACLEPERFQSEVKVLPKIDRRTKDGKAQFEALYTAQNTTWVSPEEMAICEGVRLRWQRLAQSNPDLEKALIGAQFEKALFWEFDGHLCKCKFDVVSINDDGHAHIVDLKTTKDALPDQFKWSFRNFHYDLQAYWYEWALSNYAQERSIQLHSITYLIVAIEKEAPFEGVVYRVARERSEFQGENKLQKAFSNLINKTSSYPSITTQEIY